MAIIYNYPLNSILLADDMLIGTSTKIVNGQPKNATKNFSIADLTGFIKQNISLNDVLLVGNVSLLDAKVGSLYLYDTPVTDYGNISLNQNRFSFNTVTHGEVFRAQRDMFSSFSSSGYRGSFEVSSITANQVWDFPDKSGTVALLSDVPVVSTPTLQEVATVGNTLTDTNIIFNSDFSNNEILINVSDGIYVKGIDSDKLAFIEQSGLGISNYDNTNATNLLEEGFSHTSSGGFQKLTFDTIASNEEIIIPNASGTIALLSDITIPTLQEVLDNNHDLVDGNNFQGTNAGLNNTGINVIGIGDGVAQANSGNNIVSIGSDANCAENTGNSVIALGSDTASANNGSNVIAIGFEALNANTANDVIAIGHGSSQSNSGTFLVALGSGSAQNNSGYNINAFGGNGPAAGNSGNNVNAIGNSTAIENTADHVNALGQGAGNNNSFKNVNLFGYKASADAENQNVFSKWISGTNKYLGRLSFNNITADRKWELPDADGTLALTSDITTPTLQEVMETGRSYQQTIGDYSYRLEFDGGDGAYFSVTDSDLNTFTGVQLQQDALINFVDNTANKGSSVYASAGGAGLITSDSTFGQNTLNVPFKTSGSGSAVFLPPNNKPAGTYTLAITDDIPTTSGIPHATASGTDTYTATVPDVIAYNDADAYLIRFTNGNTGSATLNINGLGAIPLYRNNDGVLIGGDIISGGEMLCVYNSTTNRFQVIGTAPNSLLSYVTNDDSVTLTKGMPVYAFGGTGDRMTVKRANNTGDVTSAQTVGLVLSTSIGVNQKGLIMMQGLLDGLSILPTGTWNDGDPVYLGATPGTITNVKPYAPNHLVYLGVVTTASNGAAGRMYVRVQNGYELDELHNVQAQTPSINDILYYFGGSPGQWKTASIPTILGYTPPKLGLVQAMTQGLQNIF
jgi:hypothetical protein